MLETAPIVSEAGYVVEVEVFLNKVFSFSNDDDDDLLLVFTQFPGRRDTDPFSVNSTELFQPISMERWRRQSLVVRSCKKKGTSWNFPSS